MITSLITLGLCLTAIICVIVLSLSGKHKRIALEETIILFVLLSIATAILLSMFYILMKLTIEYSVALNQLTSSL